MLYTARDCEPLFTVPMGEEAIEALRHTDVAGYRTRTIYAGDSLEVNSYPIWKTRAELSRAKARLKKSSVAQRAVNERNARRRIIRRIQASFVAGDLFITLTYEGDEGGLPNEEGARRDMQNYIRRVRAWRQRHGLDEMMYVYAIEFDDGEGNRKRVHHHILMSAMDRDAAEALWTKGVVNARRLQPERYEDGLQRAAKYITKGLGTGKGRRVCCSRNIKEPRTRVGDRKISRRRVERLAMAVKNNSPREQAALLEALYPGYAFISLEIKRSDFVSGAYVYALMRRRQ